MTLQKAYFLIDVFEFLKDYYFRHFIVVKERLQHKVFPILKEDIQPYFEAAIFFRFGVDPAKNLKFFEKEIEPRFKALIDKGLGDIPLNKIEEIQLAPGCEEIEKQINQQLQFCECELDILSLLLIVADKIKEIVVGEKELVQAESKPKLFWVQNDKLVLKNFKDVAQYYNDRFNSSMKQNNTESKKQQKQKKQTKKKNKKK